MDVNHACLFDLALTKPVLFSYKKGYLQTLQEYVYIKHGTNQYGRVFATLTTLCAAMVSLSILNFSVSTWVPKDTCSSFLWTREDQD